MVLGIKTVSHTRTGCDSHSTSAHVLDCNAGTSEKTSPHATSRSPYLSAYSTNHFLQLYQRRRLEPDLEPPSASPAPPPPPPASCSCSLSPPPWPPPPLRHPAQCTSPWTDSTSSTGTQTPRSQATVQPQVRACATCCTCRMLPIHIGPPPPPPPSPPAPSPPCFCASRN
jgi:hypothetical protein